MALVATLLLLAVAAVDFRVAKSLATHPRRALWVAAGALIFMLAYLYFTLWHRLLANFPWDDFIYFERVPAYAAILLILALCWYLPGRISRGTLVFLILLGGGYGLLEVSGPLLLPLYADTLSDSVERLGTGEIEVIQSTGWSCGPAALAWALQSKGVAANERELALLAGSTPFHGTGDAGLLRACHKLGQPAHMQRQLSYEQLQAVPKPCLVTWHLSGLLLHWIVVLDAGPEKVAVGDPMMGQVDYSRADFRRDWMRDALVIE